MQTRCWRNQKTLLFQTSASHQTLFLPSELLILLRWFTLVARSLTLTDIEKHRNMEVGVREVQSRVSCVNRKRGKRHACYVSQIVEVGAR